MSEKKENCELNAHLHDEDKVDSTENPKPVDSSDVRGENHLRDSASWDHNGECQSQNNRHLDSVLEYANRIRAFVGLEGDDSVEPPPPPLPKPLILDNANGADAVDDQNSIPKDIDGVSNHESIKNSATNLSLTPHAAQDPDVNTNEPDEDSDVVGNPVASPSVPTDIPSDRRIKVDEYESADGVKNQEESLPVLADSGNFGRLVNESSHTDDSDWVNGVSNDQNLDESLPDLAGSLSSGSEVLENMDSGFVDGVPTAALLKNSVGNSEEDVTNYEGIEDHDTNQLKNNIREQSIPSAMINDGCTADIYRNEKEKYLLDDENADNIKEKMNLEESNGTKLNPEGNFQNDRKNILDSYEGMKGIDNTGFEDDIPAGNEINTIQNVVEPNTSMSSPIFNDNGAPSGNLTEDERFQDTIAGKTAEIFLFDPEYVEELKNECQPMEDEEKPIPAMAVLRRLSADVVNQVLGDAENQIREILDERKRSNIELNNLVSNAEEFVRNTFPEGNTSELDTVVNGKVPAVEGQTQKNPEQLSNNKRNEIQLKDVLAKTYDFHDFQKKIESEMNKFDPRYDVDPDTICGIGSFQPKWIQPYATEMTYLVLYSIVGMLSGCYYTYLIGTISTLEKRFTFKSKVSGTIMMVDEITPLFLGILIGYFGGKSHKPRMLGLGMLLSAICCFVSALPYFIYGPATHLNTLNVRNETNSGICDGEPQQENCDSDDRPPTLAAVLFLMLGSFLKGFGNLAYYAIGLAYMDDNSKKKNTPMYFAVSMSLRLVGPFLGFLLSSACLKFNENPFEDPGFGPGDPRWIGGWWMGFLLQGSLLLVFAIPISLFPRRLPGSRPTFEKSKNTENITNFSGLIAALKRLGKNPLFLFLTLNTIMTVFGGFGHYIMLPKYMENQFHLSSSDASLLSGPPGLAAVMISTVIGGYLIWKFKPNPKILTFGMILVEVVGVLGFLILMFPQCERVQMTNFGLTNEGLILDNACNADCNCTTSSFTPVCGPDGKTTFFSPCYAGCSTLSNQTFSNCSCVSDSVEEQFVTDGYCLIEGCWSQVLAYLITLPSLQMIMSLLRVAHPMLLLRSIQPEDKSIALGTFETFVCAFGFIPFPVVYGSIVDATCLVWESSCGKTGNCWFYDVDKFNYLLHGSSAGFSFLSVLCLIAVFYLNGRVNSLYDDDEVMKCSDDGVLKQDKE